MYRKHWALMSGMSRFLPDRATIRPWITPGADRNAQYWPLHGRSRRDKQTEAGDQINGARSRFPLDPKTVFSGNPILLWWFYKAESWPSVATSPHSKNVLANLPESPVRINYLSWIKLFRSIQLILRKVKIEQNTSKNFGMIYVL